MRTTVTIDDVLLEQAKRRATSAGATLSSYLKDALRQRLATLPTPASRTVELITMSGGRPRPGVDLPSCHDLLEAMDLEDLNW
ncbi:MAG: ribbon-helix-helix domain-containing protein [Propionibacteriaceae bacterium]|jgi:hypothetical protein|nr:ribbon-helix-helix domain-containing protein [Propionibacteriaceae bacterium]